MIAMIIATLVIAITATIGYLTFIKPVVKEERLIKIKINKIYETAKNLIKTESLV